MFVSLGVTLSLQGGHGGLQPGAGWLETGQEGLDTVAKNMNSFHPLSVGARSGVFVTDWSATWPVSRRFSFPPVMPFARNRITERSKDRNRETLFHAIVHCPPLSFQ